MTHVRRIKDPSEVRVVFEGSLNTSPSARYVLRPDLGDLNRHDIKSLVLQDKEANSRRLLGQNEQAQSVATKRSCAAEKRHACTDQEGQKACRGIRSGGVVE